MVMSYSGFKWVGGVKVDISGKGEGSAVEGVKKRIWLSKWTKRTDYIVQSQIKQIWNSEGTNVEGKQSGDGVGGKTVDKK